MTKKNNITAYLLLVLVFVIAFSGCQRGVEPAAAAQSVVKPCTTDADCERKNPEATPHPVYLCGARTKAGGTCKRHVKVKGEYCWMHKDQRAK